MSDYISDEKWELVKQYSDEAKKLEKLKLKGDSYSPDEKEEAKQQIEALNGKIRLIEDALEQAKGSDEERQLKHNLDSTIAERKYWERVAKEEDSWAPESTTLVKKGEGKIYKLPINDLENEDNPEVAKYNVKHLKTELQNSEKYIAGLELKVKELAEKLNKHEDTLTLLFDTNDPSEALNKVARSPWFTFKLFLRSIKAKLALVCFRIGWHKLGCKIAELNKKN